MVTFTRTFDVLGNLLEETDANGYTSSWEYDLLNRLITYTQPDADGNAETEGDTPAYHYFYDDASQLTSVVDPLSRETAFDYNPLGYRTSVTLPDPDGDPESGDDGPTTTYSVDTLGHVTSVVDAMQNETQFLYDHLYRVITVTGADPDGDPEEGDDAPVVHYSWDLADQLLTTTDAMGRVVRNSYDLLGRLTTVMLPDPTELEGEDGSVRSFSYDALDRLTEITDPDPDGVGQASQPVTSTEYDALGRIVTVTLPDPDGENGAERPFYSYAYNDASELTSVTDAMDRTTDYQYNPLGFRTHVILPDPDGENELERPEYVTDFDPMGNAVAQTDPLGHTVATTFDHLYRPITITQEDPNGDPESGADAPVTHLGYNLVGDRTSLTDPTGNTTAWTFDGLDRVIQEENELGDSRYWTYDLVGNVTDQIDRNERVIHWDYDNLYRRIDEKWLAGESVVRTISFDYNLDDELVSASDPDSALAFGYDFAGRVTSVDNDGTPGVPNVVLTYAYDALNRRTSVLANIDSTDDFQNTYTWDGLSRLTRVDQAGVGGGNTVAEKRVDFGYFADGQFDTITRYKDTSGGGGNLVVETSYGYDPLGRLISMNHEKTASVLVAGYDWTYDQASRITSFVSSNDGTSDYTYDNINELVAVDHSFQSDESYSFDENGNRTGGGYDTDTNNRMVSDGTFDYEFDDEGNRTLRTRISSSPADDHTTEYDWDYRNRLTDVTFKDNVGDVTKAVRYSYDVFDRRISTSLDTTYPFNFADAVVTYYVCDGENVVLDFIDDDGAGAGDDPELAVRYLFGPAVDQVLSQEDAGTHDVTWQLADNQGTVRDLVDNDADVIEHYTYTSFGKVTDGDTSLTRYLYTGREFDPDTGDYYYRARFYDPANGRFLNQDPMGFGAGDTNLTRYVHNGATNYVDPFGAQESSIDSRLDKFRENVAQLGYSPAQERALDYGFLGNELTKAIRAQDEHIANLIASQKAMKRGGFSASELEESPLMKQLRAERRELAAQRRALAKGFSEEGLDGTKVMGRGGNAYEAPHGGKCFEAVVEAAEQMTTREAGLQPEYPEQLVADAIGLGILVKGLIRAGVRGVARRAAVRAGEEAVSSRAASETARSAIAQGGRRSAAQTEKAFENTIGAAKTGSGKTCFVAGTRLATHEQFAGEVIAAADSTNSYWGVVACAGIGLAGAAVASVESRRRRREDVLDVIFEEDNELTDHGVDEMPDPEFALTAMDVSPRALAITEIVEDADRGPRQLVASQRASRSVAFAKQNARWPARTNRSFSRGQRNQNSSKPRVVDSSERVRRFGRLWLVAWLFAAGLLIGRGLVSRDERPRQQAISELASSESGTYATEAIENLVEGDSVLAANLETGERERKRIVQVFRRTSDHLRILTFRGASGSEQVLKTTNEHPFWIHDVGWRDAVELAVGDQVTGPHGEIQTLAETHYEPHPEGVPVFNVETEGCHTYYVVDGSAACPILVHNCNVPAGKAIENPAHSAADYRRLKDGYAAQHSGSLGPANGLDDLARFRKELGPLPSRKSPDGGTVARLDAGGRSFYGVSAHGQEVTMKGVNPISITHAETDAFQQAASAGVRGGKGRLFVDKDLCIPCQGKAGVTRMMEQLGLDELEVITPSGTEVFHR